MLARDQMPALPGSEILIFHMFHLCPLMRTRRHFRYFRPDCRVSGWPRSDRNSHGSESLRATFRGFAPLNSKKCDAGTRERPAGKRRPSERKLMIGAPSAALAESPSAIAELKPVLHLPDHRGGVGRPDVVPRLQVRRGPTNEPELRCPPNRYLSKVRGSVCFAGAIATAR